MKFTTWHFLSKKRVWMLRKSLTCQQLSVTCRKNLEPLCISLDYIFVFDWRPNSNNLRFGNDFRHFASIFAAPSLQCFQWGCIPPVNRCPIWSAHKSCSHILGVIAHHWSIFCNQIHRSGTAIWSIQSADQPINFLSGKPAPLSRYTHPTTNLQDDPPFSTSQHPHSQWLQTLSASLKDMMLSMDCGLVSRP